MNKRIAIGVLAAIIIAAGIGTYALLNLSQLTQPTITPQPTTTPPQETQSTQASSVTIRAINLDNDEIAAHFSIEGKAVEGETPYKLVLFYGVYTFVLKYQDIEIRKTVEINQPVQEVIVQFNVRRSAVELEITTDELFARLAKAQEFKDWLLSLENKTIRITGEVTALRVDETKGIAKIIFKKTIEGSTYWIVVEGKSDIILKQNWKKTPIIGFGTPIKEEGGGDLVTLEAIVKELVDSQSVHPQGYLLELIRVVKIYQ